MRCLRLASCTQNNFLLVICKCMTKCLFYMNHRLTDHIIRHAGQVGYIICGMKHASEAHIGDTFHHLKSKVEPLPGFEAAKSMVDMKQVASHNMCLN